MNNYKAKQEELKKIINTNKKSIHEVINDKKLIYFIEKMITKSIKEHRRNGIVSPETLFVIEDKETKTLTMSFINQSGTDKQTYFDAVGIIEKMKKPKYVISVSEGWMVEKEKMSDVVEKYGSISNHPEAIDSFHVFVKTSDAIYTGAAVVDKKIGSLIWDKQEKLLGEINFKTFEAV